MNNNNEFGKHPSEEIQKIFSQRPFQIQEPEKAKVIFLGLDANIDKDIEQNKPFFNEFIEYLRYGVKYWENKGFHTPMLVPYLNYKGNGVRYHKQFCKLEFSPKHAEDICFLELLNFCTYGKTSKNKKLFMEMLNDNVNKDHLDRIKNLYKMENRICISKGVKRIIDKLKLFDTNNKKIEVHTHFSGRIKDEDLRKLGLRLRKYLDN